MAQVFCNLEVISTQRISPSLHQVTIGGKELDHFPEGQAGGYLKLVLEHGDAGQKPLLRTYTIRAQRERALDLWFALHGENAAGPATRWALEAKTGDPITIRGPGPAKPLPAGRDFYWIAGDMAALPAIAANLEAMAQDARGVCVLEIPDEGDQIALQAPSGMAIQWLVNPAPGTRPERLAQALRAASRPAGTLGAWAAAEFSSMRQLRLFLRDELGLGPCDLYISSYWKHGLDEGEHKQVKREDAAAQG